jgi:hypothetical protein
MLHTLFHKDLDQFLLQIMQSLGTSRPQPLLETEDEAWNAFLRISSGSTAEKELPTFLAAYDELRQRWNDTDWNLAFFHSGKTMHLYVFSLFSFSKSKHLSKTLLHTPDLRCNLHPPQPLPQVCQFWNTRPLPRIVTLNSCPIGWRLEMAQWGSPK